MNGPEGAGDLEALLRAETRDLFVIERELGGDGWGAVYLATEIPILRPVAIKAFPPHATT